MLSIQNVTSSQASTYYSKDAYYTRDQLSGQWLGQGAERLNLTGDFKQEDFEHIIHGRNIHGANLIERGMNGKHQAGKDLTFSAPKSVSVLCEVLGEARVRDIHEKAVREALAYTEAHFSEARITRKGVTETVRTGNLVIAVFRHNTSRELDPQLHSHALVMNMTQRSDGQWRALASDKRQGDVFYGNKLFIGQIYRNELARQLRALGYEVLSDRKGLFEIKGMDPGLPDAFSSRKQQIDEQVKALRAGGLYPSANEQKLREIAALGSRVSKKEVDLDRVRASWEERLHALGHSKASLMAGIGQIQKQPTQESPYAYIRMSVEALTEKEAVFTRKQVLESSLKLSVGQYGVDDFEKAFDTLTRKKTLTREQLLEAGNLICKHLKEDFANFSPGELKKQLHDIFDTRKKEVHPIDIVTLDKKEGLYTTREMQGIEKDILRKVQSGRNALKPFVPPDRVDQFLSKHYAFMTDGQRNAVRHILSSSDRYAAIQGDAGVGKTTSLKAVNELCKEQGYTLRGLAYTGKAGSEMMQKAGIESQTLHAFLSGFDKNLNFTKGRELWVVDEASMIGNRQMHALMNLAERVEARVVLMGDTKQLSAIEAGRIFAKLQETHIIPRVQMKEVLRQKDKTYKAIVKDVSVQEIDRAFEKLRGHEKLIALPDKEALNKQLLLDYTQQVNPKEAIVVTTFNKDRKALNTTIRESLQAQGTLPKEEHTFRTRESQSHAGIDRHFAQSYWEGDIVTINKSGAGIKVGEEGRITHVNREAHTISIVTPKGVTRQIDVKAHGEKLSVFAEKETPLCQGEKVIFLKNNKHLKVQNGLTGQIQSINTQGDITVVPDMQTRRQVRFNLKDYNYLDHGYVVTDYKSQGQTADKVFYHAPAYKELKRETVNSYNSFYVSLTRGKSDIKVYTDNTMTFRSTLR